MGKIFLDAFGCFPIDEENAVMISGLRYPEWNVSGVQDECFDHSTEHESVHVIVGERSVHLDVYLTYDRFIAHSTRVGQLRQYLKFNKLLLYFHILIRKWP